MNRSQPIDEMLDLNPAYMTKTPGILGGRARLADRRIGVVDIVNYHLRLAAPVDEICQRLNVSPAQVHAALAYYYDHHEEIDASFEEENRLVEQHTDSIQQDERRNELLKRHALQDIEMTVSEIASEFKVTARVVRTAAARGWIAARKSGATWLIRRSDAAARWGNRQP